MKITFNPKLLLLLIIGIIFFSCENRVDDLPGADDHTSNYDKFKVSKVSMYSNSSGSKLTGESVYDYDDAGNLITETNSIAWNSNMYVQSTVEYEYSDNKKAKETHYFRNEIPGGELNLNRYVNYFYNGELLTKIENHYGFDSSLDYSQHFEYDERGNLISEYCYNPSDGIYRHKKYVYDNQNRLIEELANYVGEFYPYLKNIYDNKGRLIKVEYLEYDGLSQYKVNTYYTGTNLLGASFIFDKNDNQIRKLRYYYDDLGNLTEEVINDECSVFKRKYNGKLLIEEITYWAHEYGYHGTGQMPENGMSRYEYKIVGE